MDIELIKSEYAKKEIKAELYRLVSRIVELDSFLKADSLAKSFDAEAGDVYVEGEDGVTNTKSNLYKIELDAAKAKFDDLKSVFDSFND